MKTVISTEPRPGVSETLRQAVRRQLIAASMMGCVAPAIAMAADDTPLAEIVVTATHRETSSLDVPFNVSAYGQQQLDEADVTDINSLSHAVPGLSLPDRGPAYAAATVPIIRGLNASAVSGYYQQGAQPPVTMYVGDIPVSGYLPLEDVQRVEVLRGPQGTLYGSGSLGGAVRDIPNRPQFDAFTADVSTEGSSIDHAANLGYRVSGVVNAPLSDTLAVRANASYEESPGYIKQIGVMVRAPGPITSAEPILANPADIAGSAGIFTNVNDINYSGVTNVRGAVAWQPVHALQVNLSYQHARAFGGGRNADDDGYSGGADSIDPRIQQPALGPYEEIERTREPWFRQSDLAALESSLDVGFATITSATGYFNSKGMLTLSTEGELLNLLPGVSAYYTGQPVNPRLIAPATFEDTEHTATTEMRIVSKGTTQFDWTAGAFYMNQNRGINDGYYGPGANAQTIASGSPYVITTMADGSYFSLIRGQHFLDRSLFGELSWHLTDKAQITAGARQLWQDFTSVQSAVSTIFLYNVSNDESISTSHHIFKLNASYDVGNGQRIYATWSQGYRRGGINAFPIAGPVAEPTNLLPYKPDTTNNYEIGLKGQIGRRWTYTIDVFDVQWSNAQLDIRTPVNLWPVVVNSNGARSRGVEFETTFKMFDDRMTITMGGAYADATLTRDFSLPAAYGVPITGQSGNRLPGAPEVSASLLLSYSQPLAPGFTSNFSVYGSYSGAVLTDLISNPDSSELPAYSLWGASAMLHGPTGWAVGAFCNNLFNKRVVYGSLDWYREPTGEFNSNFINQPRQIGLRAQYSWR